MTLINRYLDEAIQRCLELARVAGDSASEAEGIRVGAEALEDVAGSEAGALHEVFVGAIAALREARERIAHETDGAATALAATAAEGGEATTAVEGLLSAVQEGAGQLQQLRARLGETIDVETDAVEIAIEAQGDAGRVYSSRLESGIQSATTAGDALSAGCSEAGDLTERAGGRFAKGLAALAATAVQATMDLVAAVEATLMALGVKALDFGNAALSHHNDAVHALRTGFTGEEPGQAALAPDDAWPGLALAPMGDAAAELADLRDAAQESVRAAVPGLAESAGAARQKLLGITAAFEGLFPLQRA